MLKQFQSQEAPKAKFKKELAEEMGLGLRTLQRRLDEADIKIPRGLISPGKQQEIFKKLTWRNLA